MNLSLARTFLLFFVSATLGIQSPANRRSQYTSLESPPNAQSGRLRKVVDLGTGEERFACAAPNDFRRSLKTYKRPLAALAAAGCLALLGLSRPCNSFLNGRSCVEEDESGNLYIPDPRITSQNFLTLTQSSSDLGPYYKALKTPIAQAKYEFLSNHFPTKMFPDGERFVVASYITFNMGNIEADRIMHCNKKLSKVQDAIAASIKKFVSEGNPNRFRGILSVGANKLESMTCPDPDERQNSSRAIIGDLTKKFPVYATFNPSDFVKCHCLEDGSECKANTGGYLSSETKWVMPDANYLLKNPRTKADSEVLKSALKEVPEGWREEIDGFRQDCDITSLQLEAAKAGMAGADKIMSSMDAVQIVAVNTLQDDKYGAVFNACKKDMLHDERRKSSELVEEAYKSAGSEAPLVILTHSDCLAGRTEDEVMDGSSLSITQQIRGLQAADREACVKPRKTMVYSSISSCPEREEAMVKERKKGKVSHVGAAIDQEGKDITILAKERISKGSEKFVKSIETSVQGVDSGDDQSFSKNVHPAYTILWVTAQIRDCDAVKPGVEYDLMKEQVYFDFDELKLKATKIGNKVMGKKVGVDRAVKMEKKAWK